MSINEHGELWGNFREKVTRTQPARCTNWKMMTWLWSPNGWRITDIGERRVRQQRQGQGSRVRVDTFCCGYGRMSFLSTCWMIHWMKLKVLLVSVHRRQQVWMWKYMWGKRGTGWYVFHLGGERGVKCDDPHWIYWVFIYIVQHKEIKLWEWVSLRS